MMLGIAVLLGAVAMAAISVLRMAHGARMWPTVEGKVVAADEVRGIDGVPYHFQYEYVVDGRRFLSGTVAALASEKFELDTLRKHPVGSRVVVYYLRTNPKRSVLTPGAPPRLWAIVAALAIVSIAAFAVAFGGM
jgi:hypothetical protein